MAFRQRADEYLRWDAPPKRIESAESSSLLDQVIEQTQKAATQPPPQPEPEVKWITQNDWVNDPGVEMQLPRPIYRTREIYDPVADRMVNVPIYERPVRFRPIASPDPVLDVGTAEPAREGQREVSICGVCWQEGCTSFERRVRILVNA